MVCEIKTLKDNVRMSTQELLQLINKKVEEGETDFQIKACGQHDIGGSVWSKQGKLLKFLVQNPGQRVGAMGMDGTSIIVEGSAPADVGWLNSGAEIVIKGDAGDTAAHCAAGGKIFVAGRVGTRSGALMKHDPKFLPPEFWVLKNAGAFSFEFMGGGIAVICGYDCAEKVSILGNRSCVGMVGGVVYARGNIEGLANCVEKVSLDERDVEFLSAGMKEFLEKIEKIELLELLTDFSQWSKIVPKKNVEYEKQISVKEFIDKKWFEGGLFGDLVEDNGDVYELAQVGDARLRKPVWNSKTCIGCNLCLNNCPQKAIVENDKMYKSLDEKCIGCGICEAVCPKLSWSMF